MMALPVRKSLHWHVIIDKCQCRDFLTELYCNIIISCFIDPYFIFKFNTVVLGVSQPRLVTAVTEICDCMLHDLRPCQKEVQHTLSFTLIRWNEEHKMTATTGCIYSMLPHPLQWGFCPSFTCILHSKYRICTFPIPQSGTRALKLMLWHLDTEGVDWHIDMVLLHEEEPNGR